MPFNCLPGGHTFYVHLIPEDSILPSFLLSLNGGGDVFFALRFSEDCEKADRGGEEELKIPEVLQGRNEFYKTVAMSPSIFRVDFSVLSE
ncbi:Hypothetical protein FKW44_001718 [Caligus rogercresseyi]|uniref:Uncharacterized protein n=1 Tax=Caligus rogercresseyi TaxID=217165 RepID=A0A7T8KJ63_CALRO|nr:Hypothetical protein FKW44_001718 [Caligus rogercresseyi]